MAGMRAEEALALSKSYTEKTVIGMGAIKGDTGAPGRAGADGTDGQDGFSPIVTVTETTDGHNVSIQDANGVKEFEVLDGENGTAGADGKSAYQTWLDLGNTGTEQDFIDSLSGSGSSLYEVTGEITAEGEITLDQTFEEIKTAYDSDSSIVAKISVADGEATYLFNLLYVLEDAIAFEWINSAAKTGGQINLMSDNTVSFTMTSFESGGESYDDTEIRELVNGKQDATIFIDATMSTVKDSWDNYLLNVDEEYRYSKVQDMLVDGKTVILRVKVDGVLVELPCVSYESYTDATLTFAAPYYNSSTEEKGSYIAFCASTVGWKLGIKVVKEASSTDMSPFIIKSAYTEGSNGFTIDTSTTTPALWNDWYPAFEAGRPVYWDLHRNSIDSNVDVIRLYPHSHGIYYESTGTKECQFTSIGGYPDYDSKNDSTKYFYIGWFRSGSAPASNYKFVKQYKIGEIPTGGTTGQILVKKSDTDRDVKWADPTTGGLVITGNYSTDDADNWIVSNIDKTFAEINEAIANNQDVILKIYPEGDTSNPYILYPAMHYANMGTAFSLMVSDTGQISGLSVMITADNQVVASRNAYDFTEFCNKTELDERLGGKEVKIINNQFGDVTKLFRITDAPAESGKGYTVKLVAQRKNATIHSEYLSVSRVNDTYTYDSTIELQERNGSTGESTTMENSNFLIVDANHEVWAHIPSYTYAYVELISPNVKGTFVIDGSEGEFAEDAVLETFSKRDTDTFAKKGELDALKKSVSDGKILVAGAITDKGVQTATDDEFATMAENIGKIEAPVIDLKYSEGTKDLFSSYVSSITAGSNTFVAWSYADKSMYYSEDGGKTWQLSNLANLTGLNAPTIIYAKEYDIFAILLSATGHGVYISQDGGKTWTLQMGYSNVNTLAYSNGIFVGCSSNTTSGGITYSPDGVYWSLNANFSSKAITNLKCVNNRWFFVCDGTTYTSADGYNWTALTGTVSGSKLTNIIYYQGVWLASASGSSTTVFYSNDGVTWNACAFNWSNAQYGNSIQALSRIGNTYVASTYNGMYYSTDRGKTWNASNITAGNHKLQLFAGKLLALGNNGPGTGKGVYASADGKTWTQATTFPNASNTNGNVFIKNGKILVTGSDSALYVSSNGDTWTKVEDSCTLYSEFNGILIAKQFKYSMDGINWKSIKPADTTQTLAEYYYFGCNTILACSSPLGVYYSKAYFS